MAVLTSDIFSQAPVAFHTVSKPWFAQGEPFIVNIGWAALAASFSFSLAAVVWGRSGM
jgi:cytochrome b6-f complex subunit 8